MQAQVLHRTNTSLFHTSACSAVEHEVYVPFSLIHFGTFPVETENAGFL